MSEATNGLPLPQDECVRMTADVKITKRENQPGSVIVNGEEMNMQILSGSLSVTFPQPDEDPYRDAYVTFTLAANVEMDIDSEVAMGTPREADVTKWLKGVMDK